MLDLLFNTTSNSSQRFGRTSRNELWNHGARTLNNSKASVARFDSAKLSGALFVHVISRENT